MSGIYGHEGLCDPFRVGPRMDMFPGALPPATLFIPFGDRSGVPILNTSAYNPAADGTTSAFGPADFSGIASTMPTARNARAAAEWKASV